MNMKSFAKGRYHLNAPQEIIVVRLLTTMGMATLVTVTSLLFLSLGLSYSAIGFITSSAYVSSFIFGLLLPPILEKHNIEKLLVIGISIFAAILIMLGFSSSALVAVILFIGARTTVLLIDNTASILFKDDSGSRKSFFKNQALSGSLVNLGWVVAPLLAGFLIERQSFAFAYTVGGCFVFLGALYLLLNPVPVKEKVYKKHENTLTSSVRFYFSKKHLRDAYLMVSGINIWWGYIFTFVTLFMIDNGYSSSSIGLFITATQIPLFLLEFKSHLIAERFKFKLPFFVSYLIMAAASFAVFLFPFGLISLALMITGSLALIFIEPGSELFIYEGLAPEDEERVYPIYSTAKIAGSILVRLVVSIVVLVFSFKASFVAVGLMMAFLAYRATKIRIKI